MTDLTDLAGGLNTTLEDYVVLVLLMGASYIDVPVVTVEQVFAGSS